MKWGRQTRIYLPCHHLLRLRGGQFCWLEERFLSVGWRNGRDGLLDLGGGCWIMVQVMSYYRFLAGSHYQGLGRLWRLLDYDAYIGASGKRLLKVWRVFTGSLRSYRFTSHHYLSISMIVVYRGFCTSCLFLS